MLYRVAIFLPYIIPSVVTANIWREAKEKKSASSFRRNLQREHVERLADLALVDSNSPSLRTISTLATQELRKIHKLADKASGSGLDAYNDAHLADIVKRIENTLEAKYVVQR